MWKWTSVAALWFVGVAWSQTKPGEAPAPPSYKQGDVITLQEPGKPEQKVKISKISRSKDGKMTYEVRDEKSGETAILSDSPVNMPVATDLPKRGLFRGLTRRSAPQKQPEIVPANSVSAADKAAAGSPKIGTPIIPASATKDAPKTSPRPTSDTKRKEVSGAMPVGQAVVTDWRQSWGKADDHRADLKPENIQIPHAFTQAPEFTQPPITLVSATVPSKPTRVATTAAAPVSTRHSNIPVTYPYLATPYWYAASITPNAAAMANVTN